MILICYDGSADARAAIEHGGRLLSGHKATVLTVWHPFRSMAAATPGGFGMVMIPDVEEIDQASADAARDGAQQGAELARQAGFDAEPASCPIHSTVAEAILATAASLDAAAILMGSRGLTGLKSLLLGSVSHGVIQHADRPVIVVPSSEVALRRTDARHGTDERDERPESQPYEPA
jgi:nucleotide-binding universal stress UspA family protein